MQTRETIWTLASISWDALLGVGLVYFMAKTNPSGRPIRRSRAIATLGVLVALGLFYMSVTGGLGY